MTLNGWLVVVQHTASSQTINISVVVRQQSVYNCITCIPFGINCIIILSVPYHRCQVEFFGNVSNFIIIYCIDNIGGMLSKYLAFRLVFVGYTHSCLSLCFDMSHKDYGRIGYSDDDDALFNNVFVIDYATFLRKSKEQKVPKTPHKKTVFSRKF